MRKNSKVPFFYGPGVRYKSTFRLYFHAEGQAQSKKLARRKAAIIVLEEMKKVIEAEEKEKPQQVVIFCLNRRKIGDVGTKQEKTVTGKRKRRKLSRFVPSPRLTLGADPAGGQRARAHLSSHIGAISRP